MPTLEHDGVVELFRDNPRLALRILEEIFHVPVPRDVSVRVADSSLDQLLPIQFRADLVFEVVDADGKYVLVLPFESQREINERKKYSWAVYTAVSRAERECPSVLLIVAVDGDVAAWAAEPIDMGFGLGVLHPLVLGPATLPQIVDERKAMEDVELSVLSAMAHGNGTNGLEVLGAAFEGIRTLDREHALVYFQIIWNVLREPMRLALQRLVMQKQQLAREQSSERFALEQILFEAGESKGFRDGESKGFRDGESKGFHDGELKTLREAILRGVTRRGFTLTADQQTQIRMCDDTGVLNRWLDNVFDAKTADELFR